MEALPVRGHRGEPGHIARPKYKSSHSPRAVLHSLMGMAGRSGAAAIEIALREAATSFDVRTTAQRLRARGDTHLAEALERLAAKPSPTVDRREGECLLVFSLGAGASTPCKMDLSDICSVAVGCSVEIAYCSEPEWRVLTVGFFLE